MQNAITTKEVNGYTISVYYDQFPENPREWDNLGAMIFFHERYNLGDKHSYSSSDYHDWYELEEHIKRAENAAIIIPIYMYDHSGIALSTIPFNCIFDSGKIGYMYVSREKLLKEYSAKKMTKKIKEKAIGIMNAELSCYERYVNGEIYGVIVTDTEGIEIHSCLGFYCENDAINDGMQYVK